MKDYDVVISHDKKGMTVAKDKKGKVVFWNADASKVLQWSIDAGYRALLRKGEYLVGSIYSDGTGTITGSHR